MRAEAFRACKLGRNPGVYPLGSVSESRVRRSCARPSTSREVPFRSHSCLMVHMVAASRLPTVTSSPGARGLANDASLERGRREEGEDERDPRSASYIRTVRTSRYIAIWRVRRSLGGRKGRRGGPPGFKLFCVGAILLQTRSFSRFFYDLTRGETTLKRDGDST